MKYCMKCGNPTDDEMQKFCMKCGTALEDETEVIYNNSRESLDILETKYSMKWFKFLIYFSLFAGAAINISNGINRITGFIYSMHSSGELSAETVYAFWGMPLRILDISFGLLYFGLAAFSIVTRFRLSGYKKNGPKFLYILYGANLISSLAYCVGLTFIIGDTSIFIEIFGSDIGALVITCVVFYVNYKYFSKRKELFIN